MTAFALLIVGAVVGAVVAVTWVRRQRRSLTRRGDAEAAARVGFVLRRPPR